MDVTRSISDSFSRAAQTYDQYAEVQSYAAHVCGQKMHDVLPKLPAGPVLEIGCGTGFLTQQLAEHCAGREIIAADVSTDMLAICKTRIESTFKHGHSVKFELLDAQCLPAEPKFALIAASFSFQWFADLTETLDRLMKSLLPGGVILFSFPTRESFSEWRNSCEKSGNDFSGNLLPDVSALREYASANSYELKSYETDYVLRYNSPLDFFKALRNSGAATRVVPITAPAASATSSVTPATATAPANFKRKVANSLLSVVRAWERESEAATLVTYRILIGSLSFPSTVSGASSDASTVDPTTALSNATAALSSAAAALSNAAAALSSATASSAATASAAGSANSTANATANTAASATANTAANTAANTTASSTVPTANASGASVKIARAEDSAR